MKTTIEFAREAAGDEWYLFREFMPEIHKLAELIRADERAKMEDQQEEDLYDLAVRADNEGQP